MLQETPNQNQNQQNSFFNFAENYFKNKTEAQLQKLLFEATQNAENKKELTFAQFELVGILSFIFGLDYCSMQYPKKKIIENVKTRLAAFKISQSVIFAFSKYISVHDNSLVENQNKLIEDKFNGNVENDTASFIAANLVLEVIKNSIFDIKFSTEFVELNEKAGDAISYQNISMSYAELLKINSFIYENAIFDAETYFNFLKQYEKIQLDIYYAELNKAAKIFNSIKFSVIYIESLISIKEAYERFGIELNHTDEAYEKFKENFYIRDGNLSNIETAENSEVTGNELGDGTDEFVTTIKNGELFKNTKSQEEFKDLLEKYPNVFILVTLEEAYFAQTGENFDWENVEKCASQLSEAIDILISDTDQAQSIYQFIAMVEKAGHSIDDIDDNHDDAEPSVYLKVYQKLHEILSTKLNNLKGTYEDNVKYVCQDIENRELNEITYNLDNCIKSCIIETPEQKKYLISQLYENGIKTYNHLQQIISVLETCKIKGVNASYYNYFLKYIMEENEVVKNVFEIMGNLEYQATEISIYNRFVKWFNLDKAKAKLATETTQK